MRSIVERDDHDVSGPKGRQQDLCDISFEPVAVDRAVKNHRRDHAVEAEAGDERRRLAVAVRNRHAQALAPGVASMGACHVRRGPGSVDEDEPRGIEVGLPPEP